MENVKSILFISAIFLGGYGLTFDDLGVQFMSLFFMVGVTFLFFNSHKKKDQEHLRESQIKSQKREIENNNFLSGLEIASIESVDENKVQLSQSLLGLWQNDIWGIHFKSNRQCELFFPNEIKYSGVWSIESDKIVCLNYYILPDFKTEYKFKILDDSIKSDIILTEDLSNDIGSLDPLAKVDKIYFRKK